MQLEVGKIYEGKVTGITKFGAFVEIEPGTTGMVHISEVAATFVKEISDFITQGQMVKVKVMNIAEDGKISLSMKRAVDTPPPAPRSQNRPPRSGGFNNNNNRGGNGGQSSPNRFDRAPQEYAHMGKSLKKRAKALLLSLFAGYKIALTARMTRMVPPKISALLPSRSPNLRPRQKAKKLSIKVVAAMRDEAK